MIDFNAMIRKINLQDDFVLRSPHPFAMDDVIRVDGEGVHLIVWSPMEESADMVARQHILKTLWENGIPPEVVEMDAVNVVLDRDVYWNENPHADSCPVETFLVGYRQRLTFPLTAKADGWFVLDEIGVEPTLRLIPVLR